MVQHVEGGGDDDDADDDDDDDDDDNDDDDDDDEDNNDHEDVNSADDNDDFGDLYRSSQQLMMVFDVLWRFMDNEIDYHDWRYQCFSSFEWRTVRCLIKNVR